MKNCLHILIALLFPFTNIYAQYQDNLVFVSSFRPDVTGVIHILDIQIIGHRAYCCGYIIEYEILKTMRVNLKIYNILGQEIKTLIDYEQQTGNYQIIWDGTDNYNIYVSSGIYIYKIKAGNFVQGKKMILLR